MSDVLGYNLRLLREEFDYTQKTISIHLHIDRSTYANYELCKTEPDIRTLLALSAFFHISVDDMLSSDLKYNLYAKGKTFMKLMTKSERQVMDLLWASENPLFCMEIVELSDDKTWKDSYIHSLIKSLMNKGIVKISDFKLVSRSYARTFSPAVSYDEYVLLSGFNNDELHEAQRMGEFFNVFWKHTQNPPL